MSVKNVAFLILILNIKFGELMSYFEYVKIEEI